MATLFRGMPIVMLALLSLVAGLCLTLAVSQRPSHPAGPDWGQAVWIGPPAAQAVAYFRTPLVLGAQPRKAWLQLSAPDKVEAWVNGNPVGGTTATSSNTLVYLDVTPLLKAGQNVLAVRATRQTYPGSASLRARLVWEDDTGHRGELPTQAGWLTRSFAENQPDRLKRWMDPGFVDTDWAPAVVVSGDDSAVPASSWVDRRVLQAFPRGHWISSTAVRMAGASYEHAFTLPARPQTAWIGLASHMPLTLAINNVRVLNLPASTDMTVIDAAPFLAAGDNRIRIDTSQAAAGEGLVLAGLASGDGWEQDFSSDSQWHSQDELGQSLPVNQLGDTADLVLEAKQAPRAPRLVFVNVERPGVMVAGLLLQSLLTGSLLFVVFVLVLRTAGRGLPAATLIGSLRPVLLLGILLLVGLLLTAQDVRLWAAPLLSVTAVLLILVAVLAVSLLALRELRHGTA